MKTTEDILNEMLSEIPFKVPESVIPYIQEAMQIYAIEALKEAAERVTFEQESYVDENGLWDTRSTNLIDKQSILDIINELK